MEKINVKNRIEKGNSAKPYISILLDIQGNIKETPRKHRGN